MEFNKPFKNVFKIVILLIVHNLINAETLCSNNGNENRKFSGIQAEVMSQVLLGEFGRVEEYLCDDQKTITSAGSDFSHYWLIKTQVSFLPYLNLPQSTCKISIHTKNYNYLKNQVNCTPTLPEYNPMEAPAPLEEFAQMFLPESNKVVEIVERRISASLSVDTDAIWTMKVRILFSNKKGVKYRSDCTLILYQSSSTFFRIGLTCSKGIQDLISKKDVCKIFFNSAEQNIRDPNIIIK